MIEDDISYLYVNPELTEAFAELGHEHHGWQRKEKDEGTGDICTRKKD